MLILLKKREAVQEVPFSRALQDNYINNNPKKTIVGYDSYSGHIVQNLPLENDSASPYFEARTAA